MSLPRRRHPAPAGNTAVIQLVITQDEIPVTSATGTVDVWDEEAEALVATALPFVLVPSSAGVYRAIADDTVFEEGTDYRCDVEMQAAGGVFRGELFARGIRPDVTDQP